MAVKVLISRIFIVFTTNLIDQPNMQN